MIAGSINVGTVILSFLSVCLKRQLKTNTAKTINLIHVLILLFFLCGCSCSTRYEAIYLAHTQAHYLSVYWFLRVQRTLIIVYAHGRRLCSNWVRHESTTISYPQCSLTFMRERYLHRSFAYAKSAVGTDVVSVHKLFAYRVVSTVSTDIVSSHTKYCRIAYGITR